MVRGLYTAAAGMNAQQNNIDVTSNNIANVNTTGFKKDRAEFADLMYQSLNYTANATSENTNNPTGMNVGLGVRVSGIQKSFIQGSLKETGNSLDIAIQGKGFFQIETPAGDTNYSRNGSFKLDSDGAVVTGQGYKLLPEIVIPANMTNTSIAADGTVSAINPADGTTNVLGQITLVDFINPAGLSPKGNGLFSATTVSGDAIEGVPNTEAFGSLQQGMLESSNVQLVNAMVDLITAQRAYESNSKSLTTTDQMLQQVNQLKR
ncbi:MAG TPA: flagellar basal-body rod protein FlgG [Arcobacter sp.]|nr:flagellar basal-body rod protein FlgG [Arcobacter sp.]HIP55942.1 flagellar basal-body rod protein FlgG [Arcobacter sp.]